MDDWTWESKRSNQCDKQILWSYKYLLRAAKELKLFQIEISEWIWRSWNFTTISEELKKYPSLLQNSSLQLSLFFLSSRFIFHASSVWKIVPINVTKHVRIWLKSWYQKILSSGRSKITLKLHILLLPSSALSTTTFLSLQQQLQLRNRLKKVYCVCLPI